MIGGVKMGRFTGVSHKLCQKVFLIEIGWSWQFLETLNSEKFQLGPGPRSTWFILSSWLDIADVV